MAAKITTPMTRMKALAATMVAFALAVALLLPAVHAEDGDEWETERRRVEVQRESDGFELRSDRAVGALHDRIVLRLDGPDVRFRYKLLEERNATRAEAELRVELDQLVEFRDVNGDGVLRPAEDAVRATYDRGDLAFAGVTSVDVVSAGVPGVQVIANYTFLAVPNATLGFRATVFGDPTTFEGTSQTPVQIKLDLLLDAFPFTEADTRPAITLKAEIESRFAASATTEAMMFSAGNLSAVFRWRPTADVDGIAQAVGVAVTPLPGEAEPGEQAWGVAFAYERGASIVHDPTFGFTLESFVRTGGGILGDVGLFALGAGAAAVLFLVLALAGKQRKVKRP